MILKKYLRRWDWFWLSPEAKARLTAIGMSPKQLEEKERSFSRHQQNDRKKGW